MLAPYAVAEPLLSKQFSAAPFNAIDIAGDIRVEIINGQTQPSLQLIGDSNSLKQAYASVKEGILYLSTTGDSTAPMRLLARVSSCSLNQLNYTGSGHVIGANLTGPLTVISKGSGTLILSGDDINLRRLTTAGTGNVNILGINSGLLDIDDNGSGKVNLEGNMVLQNLVYNSDAPLSISWVNSTNVNITGNGRGRIFLAGNAGQIAANVSDHAYLDAKYLRAKRGFIQTQDSARADVWTQCALNTLAKGGSTIYYYNDPPMLNNYTKPPGTVLSMVGINADDMPMPAPSC